MRLPWQRVLTSPPQPVNGTRDEMTRGDWKSAGWATTYLVLLTLFTLYTLFALWPPPAPPSEATFSLYIEDPVQVVASDSTEATATFKVKALASGGYSDPVQFSVTPTEIAAPSPPAAGPATGTQPKSPFDPPNLTPGTGLIGSTLKIHIGNKAKIGKYFLKITGTASDRSRSAMIALIIADKDQAVKYNTRATEAESLTGPLARSADTVLEERRCVHFFWSTYSMLEEVRLGLLVLAAATLGGLVQRLRSLYWYIGNREYRSSWLHMYCIVPLTGAVLGLGFYFIVRGGFFSPSTTAKETSAFSFVGTAFLIGLFSRQATDKLKQIFETAFASPPEGKDAATLLHPGFQLEVDRQPQRIGSPPLTVLYTVRVKSTGSFADPVTLSIGALPAGVTGSFNPTTVIPTTNGASSELTLTRTEGSSPGQYQITIIGTSDGKKQEQVVLVDV